MYYSQTILSSQIYSKKFVSTSYAYQRISTIFTLQKIARFHSTLKISLKTCSLPVLHCHLL